LALTPTSVGPSVALPLWSTHFYPLVLRSFIRPNIPLALISYPSIHILICDASCVTCRGPR
jgi:hypothetical protein